HLMAWDTCASIEVQSRSIEPEAFSAPMQARVIPTIMAAILRNRRKAQPSKYPPRYLPPSCATAGEVKFPIQDASPPTVATPTATKDFAIQGGSARMSSQVDDRAGAGEQTCSSSTINVSPLIAERKRYHRPGDHPYRVLCEARSRAAAKIRESRFPVARSRATSSEVGRRRSQLRRGALLQSHPVRSDSVRDWHDDPTRRQNSRLVIRDGRRARCLRTPIPVVAAD